MNTILLGSLKIVIFQDIDKCLDLLEECMDIDPIHSDLSRLIDLVLYLREYIMHI